MQWIPCHASSSLPSNSISKNLINLKDMSTKLRIIILVALSALPFFGCEVENPNVTEDAYIETPKAAATWINGMRRQATLMMGRYMELTELISDNYFNNRTLSSKVFDIPLIGYTDPDVRTLQREVSRLLEMGEYGTQRVVPNDVTATNADKAEISYWKGFAHLIMGEFFTGLPIAANQAAANSQAHFQLAINDFNQALSLDPAPAKQLLFRLGLARVYHRLGDKANAITQCNAVITGNPLFLEQLRCDGLNGVRNEFQFYLFDSSFNEFAPLPRLDFLDPKYFSVGTATLDQKPVTIAKGEEAYLILAEAQLSNNQLDAAKTSLKSLLTNVIAKRPVVEIDDVREKRAGGVRTDYPLSDTVRVKFSADEPEIRGLILNRQKGKVKVGQISGTSVTEAQINNATSVDALLELVYLMRQEIFIAEARRAVDLGIKLPVSDVELLNNSKVGQDFIQAQIPSFIPDKSGLDDFTYDRAKGVATMRFNMNKILVANKTSPLVLPFH